MSERKSRGDTPQKRNPAVQGGTRSKTSKALAGRLIARYAADESTSRVSVYDGRNFLGEVVSPDARTHIALTASGRVVGIFPKRTSAAKAVGA